MADREKVSKENSTLREGDQTTESFAKDNSNRHESSRAFVDIQGRRFLIVESTAKRMPVQQEMNNRRTTPRLASPREALAAKPSGFHTRYLRPEGNGEDLSLESVQLDSPQSHASNPQEPFQIWLSPRSGSTNTNRAWRERVHAVAVLPHASE